MPEKQDKGAEKQPAAVETKDKKKPAAGDAPPDKKKRKDEPAKEPSTPAKDVKDMNVKIEEEENYPKTKSQIALAEAEARALQRKRQLQRKKWPEVTKVRIVTKPWSPPPPPQKLPPIEIYLPDLKLKKWIPPQQRPKRPRPKLQRIPPQDISQALYECSRLNKVYHNFKLVDTNKMMLQGHLSCNSKKYSATHCAAQTACIALVARALLDEKAPEQLVKMDVDDVIEHGDRYYRNCMIALKCYKGNPHLQLQQLLPWFFFRDTKYSLKMEKEETGVLAKAPDSTQEAPDLMGIMEKVAGTTYAYILTVGTDKHFFIWGHPPAPESGSSCKTVCYIFEPHMLNDIGQPEPVTNACCGCHPPPLGKCLGGAAFLRYPGVNSFVIDFLSNYGDLSAATRGLPKPTVTLTSVEITQKDPLIREPTYELDMKALSAHCRSMWEELNKNYLLERKRYHGEHPFGSLSAVSLATSRKKAKSKMTDFYQKMPKEEPPPLPMPPEKPPPLMTIEQIMSQRGENFFLYAPKEDQFAFGRDDMLPRPKSETVMHSPIDIAEGNFHSQFKQLDPDFWILIATRHFASFRYQKFKTYTGVACCVCALAMLRRYRARAWNEDILDDTLDLGWNLYRESVIERGGPIRRIVLGEVKERFVMKGTEYFQRLRGIVVWGRLVSTLPKILDICRGIEQFFRESDAGVLQVPGEYETAIWNEGGKFYCYHPWPADNKGRRVGLQDGGKACLMTFSNVTRLCEHFMENVMNMRKKPFSISEVYIYELPQLLPEPVNNLKPIAENRWIVHGSFHEADERFPEEHRGKQATPISIVAIALSHLIDPSNWTPEDVNDALTRGDALYARTIDHLERMGISLEMPRAEDEGGEEEVDQTPTGTLAAADVMPRFQVSDFDCIEADVLDGQFSGTLHGDKESGLLSLKDSLKQLFKNNTHAVVTARGGSVAIWRQDDHFFFFDPHGCDENGYPTDDIRATSCLVRLKGSVDELADLIENNLPPGPDDSFNISPVYITATKLNPVLNAPEMMKDNKAFDWISKRTAAILMGPMGENSAIGKAAKRAGIPPDDLAGRTIALPAAAAFVAATENIPPYYMHQDHMYNFLETGAEYYLNHLRKTGRKQILPDDLTEKFEMGANTFTIELGESIRLPFRLPDAPAEGGGGEEEQEPGEGEEMPVGEAPPKHHVEILNKQWNDFSKPAHISLLVGDYHQFGVWVCPGGKVVVFDPAPTLDRGRLTPQRIKKGDELRLQRIKDEMTGEAAGDDEDEEMPGEGGEALPEPEPEFVPPESCPVLMVFACPQEMVDKIANQAPLDNKQRIGPHWLYPVKVTNELTTNLKDKKPAKDTGEEGGGEEEEEQMVEPLEDSAMGQYFQRMGRTLASLRGRLSQSEKFFMDVPNRDRQDAANCVMGIVVDHIEPYIYWKPQLIDAILKYGDRLYTMSLPKAAAPPVVAPKEVIREFNVTHFSVKLDIEGDVVEGDYKAPETGAVLNLQRGLKQYFETYKYGVLCCKDYCVAVWPVAEGKAFLMWDPHACGPNGKTSPGGGGAVVIFSNINELADTFKHNVELLEKTGSNKKPRSPRKYTISSVKVQWELVRQPPPIHPPGVTPDEGYEWKVLTAFVEFGKGKSILRGSRPLDLLQFSQQATLQSACGAVVAACLAQIRKPHLWTRRVVDQVMSVAGPLFEKSVGSLGYEFHPGEDVLWPLQVLPRFVLGVNYVKYEMEQAYTGKLEQYKPPGHTVRSALDAFFEAHKVGVLWSVPYAVAVWKTPGAPGYYMMEPHACGPTGLRTDTANEGAACVLCFTSSKLLAHCYLQNVPVAERPKHDFYLYVMNVHVYPIKPVVGEPSLIKQPPTGPRFVPATSRVDICGFTRRAEPGDRHPPIDVVTCVDVHRASIKRDKDDPTLKGARTPSGWLVMNDGTMFLSANHSMACSKYGTGSRGNQALPCCIVAVAMSRVEDVCKWCTSTLDQVLDCGDQLYQDSYLHFRPKGTNLLNIEQVLRKFYVPGNCACRVVVFQPRQKGKVDSNLEEQLTNFFREEKAGVFLAGNKDFAVALFGTPRGFYMFDPADRDRYGRAVAPPCTGKARACFSLYPSVGELAAKLGPNIPPMISPANPPAETPAPAAAPAPAPGADAKAAVAAPTEQPAAPPKSPGLRFETPATFEIYGMAVTGLRRIGQN